jgi:DNA invertase Pin-like site-specific DNA recombinase
MGNIEDIKERLKQNGGKLVGYARVSTDDQDCAIQIEKLNQLGCNKVYADKSTGKNVNRAQLQQCLDYMREGDVLAFTRVDRLGRSLKDLVTISDELRKKGVGLFIIQQNLDTSTPMGQMFYAMLGIMAEFEYHLKRERQTEGIARAKNLGKYTGRKPLPNNVREQVLGLLAKNVRPTKIAADLGIGRTSVYKYCQPSPEA